MQSENSTLAEVVSVLNGIAEVITPARLTCRDTRFDMTRDTARPGRSISSVREERPVVPKGRVTSHEQHAHRFDVLLSRYCFMYHMYRLLFFTLLYTLPDQARGFHGGHQRRVCQEKGIAGLLRMTREGWSLAASFMGKGESLQC